MVAEGGGVEQSLTPSVLSVSSGLAVEQIVPVPPRKKSTSRLQLPRSSAEVDSGGCSLCSSTLA